MTKKQLTGVCFLVACGVMAVLSAAAPAPPLQPNFSGSWVRVTQHCEPGEKANGRLAMVIEQRETSFSVTWKTAVKGVERELPLTYKTSGEELRYTGLDGDDFRSKLQWRGGELLFQTVERERGAKIDIQETWKLAENGAKLLRTKTENSAKEHSSCSSVFEKSEQRVKITLQRDRIAIDVDGAPFTNLYMGEAAHKPFLFPLRTASGKKVTRGFPVEPLATDPTDHPHQKGLWVGAEHLSDMDFWENDPSYQRRNMGKIVFKDVLETHAEADRGGFTMLSEWISENGEPVLTEKRRMTFYAEPADSRMFDVELDLKAKREVTFQDHHDAVIGMRLGPAFDEKNGGRPVNAQGLIGEEQIRGQRSEWVDWSADVDGEAVGVTLMDYPSNYSWPTRWNVRKAGLLVASPFAQHDYAATAADNGKNLAPGESLHLRYRVLIHPRSTNIAAAYKEFLAQGL